MWYIVILAVGMSIGYAIGYGFDYGMRVRADQRLQKKLGALSLKVDLIIEGLENIIEPKGE